MFKIINTLKALLPVEIKRYISKKIIDFDISLACIASKTKTSSTFYYLSFNSFFKREHQAILKGRLNYEKSCMDPIVSSYSLRRNIHRIEKGLIMQPRRRVFAIDYIEKTVDIYSKAIASNNFCNEEILWAKSILNKYFEVTDHVYQIKSAHAKYSSTKNIPQQLASLPYSQKNLPMPGLNYASVQQLFKRRRSVRWYQEKCVPIELIKKAVDAASMAPSACNRQPYYFMGTTEAKKATEIAQCAMGTIGFSKNIQSIIVVMGDLSAYSSERDRHLIYIDASLATMQLMLALESLGLSSCPINWPELENREKKIRKIIQFPDYHRVIMLLAVGYAEPNGGIPFSQKKNNNLLFKEII